MYVKTCNNSSWHLVSTQQVLILLWWLFYWLLSNCAYFDKWDKIITGTRTSPSNRKATNVNLEKEWKVQSFTVTTTHIHFTKHTVLPELLWKEEKRRLLKSHQRCKGVRITLRSLGTLGQTCGRAHNHNWGEWAQMMNNLNSKEYIVIFKFKDWIHETVAGYRLMLLLFKSNQSNEMLSTGIFFLEGAYIFVNFYCLVFGKVVGNTEKNRNLPMSSQNQHWGEDPCETEFIQWEETELALMVRLLSSSLPGTCFLVEMSFPAHPPHMKAGTVRFIQEQPHLYRSQPHEH